MGLFHSFNVIPAWIPNRHCKHVLLRRHNSILSSRDLIAGSSKNIKTTSISYFYEYRGQTTV
ncbi:palindromic element RPE4 domain-containing protein [Rickettsia sp. R2]